MTSAAVQSGDEGRGIEGACAETAARMAGGEGGYGEKMGMKGAAKG